MADDALASYESRVRFLEDRLREFRGTTEDVHRIMEKLVTLMMSADFMAQRSSDIRKSAVDMEADLSSVGESVEGILHSLGIDLNGMTTSKVVQAARVGLTEPLGNLYESLEGHSMMLRALMEHCRLLRERLDKISAEAYAQPEQAKESEVSDG